MSPSESDKLFRKNTEHNWKDILYVIIFRANTKAGKRFDIALLIAILISVAIILMDSVPSIHAKYGAKLFFLEWTFTVLFTIEYIIRILIVSRKKKYILSTTGIIDFLSILPAFLSIFLGGYQFLMVLRSLRLLRVFKILKLSQFQSAGRYISKALYNSYRKIVIFMMFIVLVVIIIGSFMYLIEHDSPGFESIPRAIYWAVVTITTVGYGDVSPQTPLGQFLSVIVMLCGYSIIAVPTGIITSEMAKERQLSESAQDCPRCGKFGHRSDARYCYSCAERINLDP